MTYLTDFQGLEVVIMIFPGGATWAIMLSSPTKISR